MVLPNARLLDIYDCDTVVPGRTARHLRRDDYRLVSRGKDGRVERSRVRAHSVLSPFD
jgi:hypothetical protein